KMSATPHRRLRDLRLKASRCEGSFARQTNFADGQRSFICTACIFEPYAKYNISVFQLNTAPTATEAGEVRFSAKSTWVSSKLILSGMGSPFVYLLVSFSI